MPPKKKQKYDIVLIEGSNDPPRANLYPPPDLDSTLKQIKYTAILTELNNKSRKIKITNQTTGDVSVVKPPYAAGFFTGLNPGHIKTFCDGKMKADSITTCGTTYKLE